MARMNWTRLVIALTAVLAITALPAGRPASALLTEDVPIQPGAPMIDADNWGGGSGVSFCTLNFVFKDRAKKNPKTYIGAPAFCTGQVGDRARSPEVGAFGTVVYRDPEMWRMDGGPAIDSAAHFALIRIDRNKLKYVSRVVRGFGAAPSGYTRSGTTNAGDLLITHGYPYDASAQAVTRFGLLAGDTSTRYWSSIQPNIQDRGSPVVRADGKAVGISDEARAVWGASVPGAPPVARFPTIQGLLKQLRSAGFNITLA